MTRYHKKVYFPDIKELSALNDKLNSLNWRYSVHALDNLKHRVINQYALLSYIKELKLNKDNIFEYYKEKNFISKVCYRINFCEYDFILVLSANKEIITIYLNACEDEHETLNKNLYCMA
jgi:hypothetical protein